MSGRLQHCIHCGRLKPIYRLSRTSAGWLCLGHLVDGRSVRDYVEVNGQLLEFEPLTPRKVSSRVRQTVS